MVNLKLSGAPESAHSRKDTNILVAQIILRGDYSGSVKNYGDYFIHFRVKSFERNLVRKEEEEERKTKSPFVHYLAVSQGMHSSYLWGIVG